MSAGCDLPELGHDFERAISRLPELRHTVLQLQTDTVLDQVSLDENRHFRIERRHHLIEPLDQRHFQSSMNQILHHLQSR